MLRSKNPIKLIVSAIAIIAMLVPTNAMASLTQGDYGLQSIDFYHKNACSQGAAEGDGGGAAATGENLEDILKYFTGKGLTLAQAAGIAGNMQQESGLDPTIIQGGAKAPPDYKPVDKVGFGLVQWTRTSRQKPLVDLAKSSGRKITDITLQLDNVWRELSGPYKHTLQALVKTNDPVKAAVIVHGPPWPGYEASGDKPADVPIVRGGNATRFYNQYKGKIKDGQGVQISGTTETAAPAGACEGEAAGFSDDGFVIYDQCDPKWASVPYGRSGKTACSSGCGPTAMAMAITALSGKAVTPKETVAYASGQGMYVDGVGSSWVLPKVIGDKFGVSTRKLDMDVSSINAVLKAGGLVILSGQGSAPFTGAGHYILIRAVTDSGKWKVADSNGNAGKKNSTKEWNPRDILVNANAGSTYAVTK